MAQRMVCSTFLILIHYPYFGTRDQSNKDNLGTAFEVTQKLHEIEFGNKLLAIWSDKLEL